MTPFASALAGRLVQYVKLRRSLGLKFGQQALILHRFDRFLVDRGVTAPLTQALVLEFAAAAPGGPTEPARRYLVVRHFVDYLATFEPATPRMDPHALELPVFRATPYIFTDEEMARLLDTALVVSPRLPFHGLSLHAVVGLAASTGLRIGEIVRLDRPHVDLEKAVLTVRQTKFGKDRLVPVHTTTRDVLVNYARARDGFFPGAGSSAFFLNTKGRRFSLQTLEWGFRRLTQRCGLYDANKKRPRFHDLRHSFAVGRLVAWYRSGVDVQARLPALATYMGHVEYTTTAYYLTATPELLALAADRFQRSVPRREVPS